MKATFLTAAWARGMGLALVLGSTHPASGQGVMHFLPPQPTYYSGAVPNTLDFNLDVNGDGTTDFILESRPDATAVLIPQGNNRIIAIPEPPPDLGYFVAALSHGTTIGSSLNGIPAAQWYNNQTDQFGYGYIGTMTGIGQQLVVSGYFTGQTSAYIGFDVVNNGRNYYGWMQVSNPLQFLYGDIVDWAYQSSPDTPIAAGQVPEPSTASLCILGAIAAYLSRPRPKKRHR